MLHALNSSGTTKGYWAFCFYFPLAAVASSGSSDAPPLRKAGEGVPYSYLGLHDCGESRGYHSGAIPQIT